MAILIYIFARFLRGEEEPCPIRVSGPEKGNLEELEKISSTVKVG